MRRKVLYTGPIETFEVVKHTLEHAFDVDRTEPVPEELLPKFENCDVFLDASMKVRIPADNIRNAAHLKLIVTATTGANHIDHHALEARSIPLLTLKDQRDFLRNITAAAEHSWALLMACARQLKGAVLHVDEGGWNRVDFPGLALIGKTIGIIGLGRIGGWMARYAQAFGMKVQAYDPYVQEAPEHVELVSLEALLETSDFISVHVPYSEENNGMISEERIARMKEGSVLINTSRAELTDEQALVEALASGRIKAVGVDVLGGEPDIANNPLWLYSKDHANVIITPHIGGFCPEFLDKVVEFSCKRILSYFGDGNND